MDKCFMEMRREAYLDRLRQAEKSVSTRKQYCWEVDRFLQWIPDGKLDKDTVIRYKEFLGKQYQPSSVNTKLAAVNGFLEFLGLAELKVKLLRIQRRAYCSQKRLLQRQEYQRLVRAARNRQDERLCLLLQTVCVTGIRISELPFITVEAVKAGEAVVCLKGKNRIVLLPEKLRRLLGQYLKKRGISQGPVFVTRSGAPMDRSNIWKMMKSLGRDAMVAEQKIFPHNLRHLFARCFYEAGKDIVRLADVLGYSSINTTRIYIISTGQEHRRQMEGLGLLA